MKVKNKMEQNFHDFTPHLLPFSSLHLNVIIGIDILSYLSMSPVLQMMVAKPVHTHTPSKHVKSDMCVCVCVTCVRI